MNEKLQLHEIAGYLPYGLKFLPTHFNNEKKTYELSYIGSRVTEDSGFGVNGYGSFFIKPILRPMSDLIGHKIAKEIFNDDGWLTGKSFKETVSDFVHSNNHLDFCFAKYDWDKFYEHHFDIHNLIGRGLAIDINTLNNE